MEARHGRLSLQDRREARPPMSLYVLDTDMLTLVAEGHVAVGRGLLEQRAEDVPSRCSPSKSNSQDGTHTPQGEAAQEARLGVSAPGRHRAFPRAFADSHL